eukprot:TRINITY_DN63642_c0_g1_i1.p1 TRINITY_DN63642_c0_g1~~TRINITY_DN63642_c0_g1_i1.p1  ORF type:complete len:994 (+),score=152.25 TRINITY_DN63642_c0_g1_i1:125-3106(+)
MDKFERVRVLGRGAFGVAVLVRSRPSTAASTATSQPAAASPGSATHKTAGTSGENWQEKSRESSGGNSTPGGSRARDFYHVIKQVDLAGISPEKRKETLNEVEVLRRLSHPNIVAYSGAFLENATLHIVMEFADGGDLAGAIKAVRDQVDANPAAQRFDEDDVLSALAQCVLGLQHMHKQRILHRDIKGQNIFLTKSGTAKLGDFGIAKIFEQNEQSQAKTTIGTPSYLAPEVCDNRPYGGKADIWSMGVVLYELLALRQPFQAYNVAALLLKVLTAEPEPLSEQYCGELRELAMQMLRKAPEERPTVDGILNVPSVRRSVGTKFHGDPNNVRPGTGGWRPQSKGQAVGTGGSSPTHFPAPPAGGIDLAATMDEPAEDVPAAQARTQPEPTANDQLDQLLASLDVEPCLSTGGSGPKAEGAAAAGGGRSPSVSSAFRAADADEQRRVNADIAKRARARCMGEPGLRLFGETSSRPTSAGAAPMPGLSVPPAFDDARSGARQKQTAPSQRPGEFSVRLRKTPHDKLGLTLEGIWDDHGQVRRILVVESIEQGGLVQRWNLANAARTGSALCQLHVGDHIIEVNGMRNDALVMAQQLTVSEHISFIAVPPSVTDASMATATTAMRRANSQVTATTAAGTASPSASPVPPRRGAAAGGTSLSRAGSQVTLQRARAGSPVVAGTERPPSSRASTPNLLSQGTPTSVLQRGRAGSGQEVKSLQQATSTTSVVARTPPGSAAAAYNPRRQSPQRQQPSGGRSNSPHNSPQSRGRRNSPAAGGGNARSPMRAPTPQRGASPGRKPSSAPTPQPKAASPSARPSRMPAAPASKEPVQAPTEPVQAPSQPPPIDTSLGSNEAALADRFSWAAKFADCNLSMPVFRPQEDHKGLEDNLEALMDQIERLEDSKEHEQPPLIPWSPSAMDGVPFTEEITSDVIQGLQQAPGRDRRFEMSDSWAVGTAVDKPDITLDKSPEDDALRMPESPTIGDTAALQLALLGR